MPSRVPRGPRGARSSPCTADRRARFAAAAAVLLLCAPLARAAVWSGADTLSGKHSDDQFGWSVAGTGDLDGDGFSDIVIGAHFANVGTDTAAGSVYLAGGG